MHCITVNTAMRRVGSSCAQPHSAVASASVQAACSMYVQLSTLHDHIQTQRNVLLTLVTGVDDGDVEDDVLVVAVDILHTLTHAH